MPGRDTTFSLRQAQDLVGVSRAVIDALIDAGFVTPAAIPSRGRRLSFQDLMLLRTAHALRQARVPPRRIVGALQRLRAALPEALPVTGLRISAAGGQVVVRDAQGDWEPETGQQLLAFEVTPTPSGRLVILPRPQPDDDVATLFQRAVALETVDPRRAEAAYRAALAREPDHLDSLLNLGAMLCEQRRCGDAVALYDAALARQPDVAWLHFNRAIALEDQDEVALAAQAYAHSLQLDPALADAHFNLARLLELASDHQGAIRHLNAYRRLTTREDAP